MSNQNNILSERNRCLEALRVFLGPESTDGDGHCHYCGGDLRSDAKLAELGFPEDEVENMPHGHGEGCPVRGALEILEDAERNGYARP
jgi:hypothetical protein